VPEAVANRLRAGEPLADDAFDELYPEWAQAMSRIHWTPVEVARRAAELLVSRPNMRVLDIGSGVGKFCLVGTLTTAGVFYGIEQRFHFVRAARETAKRLGIEEARFLHGNMVDLDWGAFDGYYLYNPFAENLTSVMDPIDRSIDVDPALYFDYVKYVRHKLHAARRGTRVVTYHGFGGDMPPSYHLEREEQSGTDRLELWLKVV
jgi:SAM-dependent methyltransferase